jgi:diamine N-acetyltransferase
MIKSKNIGLRAVEPEDIDFLYSIENDQEIWKVSNTLLPFSRFEIEQYVLNCDRDIYVSKQIRFIIVELSSGISIGCIDIFDFDPNNQRAGLGIIIDKIHRNSGFATEALQILIEYAFKTLHLHQLYCHITTENVGSVRLFVKNGFRYMGTRKDWTFFNGKFYDEDSYQLLNSLKQ